MLLKRCCGFCVVVLLAIGVLGGVEVDCVPHRILLDTDVDTDDFFALLYLLKLKRSEFELEAVTISANAWSDAGHAVNQVYDLLYMMGRDDVAVGVGGEGGILEEGVILPDVGGYLPIIEQGTTTAGMCRYRQAIPVGQGGRLDVDTNYGIRKAFLPQGTRQYVPLKQPTAQQVLIEKISEGPISVILIGAHTNLAIFLMNHPHLKANIERIYIMGGGVRAKNPTGCCPVNSSSTCQPQQCGDPGNLFTDYNTNPYAEFNVFGDPFAAYQVIHSGVPITLVPLDATNTIPINSDFFETFEKNQNTYEAQYCFQSLRMARDTWFNDQFYTSYFMWDSFTSGVAVSMMRNVRKGSIENEFAEMEYMDITVITSNQPYGVADGSNPFFDNRKFPKFNLAKGGVHSGHVQTGLQDMFWFRKDRKGKCKDGYTMETSGSDAVRVLVATRAKPNRDSNSVLNRMFFQSFLDMLNSPRQQGRFNFTTQFPFFREVRIVPDLGARSRGKPVIFDMDMSAGDFIVLLYLLKVPLEEIDLKAIMVTPTGWANAASIDIVYDILHMMGRDDIPVGLGDMFPVNQSDVVFPVVGDCKYVQAIAHGSGGFLDSDTLFGLARFLPRSPRRYTAENSVVYGGAPRDTEHPELRQPLVLEVWDSVTSMLEEGGPKVTVLTNAPLTSLANIITSRENATGFIEDVFIVGGHIKRGWADKGNVFTIPMNEYAEFNIFLDPLATKTVFESQVKTTVIPLGMQRSIGSFNEFVRGLKRTAGTPEARFAKHLISRLARLKKDHYRYQHMDMFLGEIVGAIVLATDHALLKPIFKLERVKVMAEGDESSDGVMYRDPGGKLVRVLESVNLRALRETFSRRLGDTAQSAVIGSFLDQTRMWGHPPPNRTEGV
ncbi:hypothetical protein MLD38_039674 [Melastoma candidum]|uniref:Uncharacterized protein n=1 Tax=Melastoma candidum TaxID=119954 RepID=A0ACB9L2S7_9MYRT|nr:hypothetical protein MLD38_039674 [Melastoma candidum]